MSNKCLVSLKTFFLFSCLVYCVEGAGKAKSRVRKDFCPIMDPYGMIPKLDQDMCCNMYFQWMTEVHKKPTWHPTPKIEIWWNDLGMHECVKDMKMLEHHYQKKRRKRQVDNAIQRVNFRDFLGQLQSQQRSPAFTDSQFNPERNEPQEVPNTVSNTQSRPLEGREFSQSDNDQRRINAFLAERGGNRITSVTRKYVSRFCCTYRH